MARKKKASQKKQKILKFESFSKLFPVVHSLNSDGLEHKHKIEGIAKFKSMFDSFYRMQEMDDKRIKKNLRKSKRYIINQNQDDSDLFDLKLDPVHASLVNKRGKVKVGSRKFNLLKKKDLKDFSDNLYKTYNKQTQRKGLVEEIICHNYQAGDTVCVSINKNTLIPSYAEAHVEHWDSSSYITRYFDTTANKKLTRIQFWKGHLLALNKTGGEISVWKPDRKLVLKRLGPFKFKCVWQEYFSQIWFPFMKNQLFFSWQLIEKSTGKVLTSYGDNSQYEAEKKWWAGRWHEHNESLDFSKFGKDYFMKYVIRDKSGIIAQGQW